MTSSKQPPPPPPKSAVDLKAERLAKALRANLGRRKVQARGRDVLDQEDGA